MLEMTPEMWGIVATLIIAMMGHRYQMKARREDTSAKQKEQHDSTLSTTIISLRSELVDLRSTNAGLQSINHQKELDNQKLRYELSSMRIELDNLRAKLSELEKGD